MQKEGSPLAYYGTSGGRTVNISRTSLLHPQPSAKYSPDPETIAPVTD